MTFCHLPVLFLVGFLVTDLHLKLFYLLNTILVPPTQSRPSDLFLLLPPTPVRKQTWGQDWLFILPQNLHPQAEYSSPSVPITLLETAWIWSPYFTETILNMGVPWTSSGRKAPKEEIVWDDLVLPVRTIICPDRAGIEQRTSSPNLLLEPSNLNSHHDSWGTEILCKNTVQRYSL